MVSTGQNVLLPLSWEVPMIPLCLLRLGGFHNYLDMKAFGFYTLALNGP